MRSSFVFSIIKGVACLAIVLFAVANKPCFADDRLLIGSFNSDDKPVQLVVANANNPMSSVLATGANQTVSSHSDNSLYYYLSGAQFLDYISYCGLDFLSSHSAQWFYDHNYFVNYYGRYDGTFIWLSFVFSKSNFVSQPVEWKTLENTGAQTFYNDSLYFVHNLGSFFFSPCWDNVLYQNVSTLYSSLQYFSFPNFRNNNNGGLLYNYNNGTVARSLYFSSSRLLSSSIDFTDTINSFYTSDSDHDFLFLTFRFSLNQYNNSEFPAYVIGYNLGWNSHLMLPLASSFYDYSFNTEDYFIYSYQSSSTLQFQFQKYSDSLAVSFPFMVSSGALAYESDFVINPTPTPTPFPTFEPWDPDNPAGGTTPTPIPSGFGDVTPSPIPSVSPPAATVTPINIFYNPEISNGGDIWGFVQSIFADFNSFFSGSQFIKFSSSIMNTFYYFDPRFKYFVIPVFVCFIVFMMGRFRKK